MIAGFPIAARPISGRPYYFFIIAVSDSAAAGDALAASNQITLSLSDSTASSDTTAGLKVIPGAISDAVATADALANVGSFVGTVTDPVAAGDTAASTATFLVSLSDSAAAADTTAGMVIVPRSIADTVTAGDTVSATVTFRETISDGVAVADAAKVGAGVKGTAQRLDADTIISLYEIDATSIAAGAIYYFTAGLLTGPQLPQSVVNACLPDNESGWNFGGSEPPATSGDIPAHGPCGGTAAMGAYVLRDFGSGFMHREAGIAAGYMETSVTVPVTVVPTMAYEMQALIQPWRCRAVVGLAFYDASNALLSEVLSDPAENADAPASGVSEDLYSLAFARAAAPADASYAVGFIRGMGLGGLGNASGSDPYVVWSKTFLGGPMASDLVGPSPWVPYEPAGRVAFGGKTYQPAPIEAHGFEWTGRGTMPRPTLRVSNINNLAAQMAFSLGDLLGAKLTRIRTFKRYLDGMPNADAGAYFEPDVWFFDRKSVHNPIFIEWELASILDQEGRKLPGRQMIRDVCGHTYRSWNATAGTFAYSGVTCPYAGSSYFDATDAATADPAADVCGKRLTGCIARFPSQTLPTWAFPGMVRVGNA